MAQNEVPFKQMLHIVEYPTESWIVMDMRKSNVFDYAAKYSHNEESRSIFFEKARFFYNTCLKDLMDFETTTFMRPLVMLMNYGIMRPYFEKYRPVPITFEKSYECDFGQPEVFGPQRNMVRKRLLIGMAYGFISLILFSAWFILT